MTDLRKAKDSLLTNLAQLRAEIQRLTIIAKKEQTDRQLDIDDSEGRWDIEAMVYPTNLLGAAQGGVAYIPKGPTATQSALSGAIGGASIGAGFGPIGAGIGAIAGFGLGLFG